MFLKRTSSNTSSSSSSSNQPQPQPQPPIQPQRPSRPLPSQPDVPPEQRVSISVNNNHGSFPLLTNMLFPPQVNPNYRFFEFSFDYERQVLAKIEEDNKKQTAIRRSSVIAEAAAAAVASSLASTNTSTTITTTTTTNNTVTAPIPSGGVGALPGSYDKQNGLPIRMASPINNNNDNTCSLTSPAATTTTTPKSNTPVSSISDDLQQFRSNSEVLYYQFIEMGYKPEMVRFAIEAYNDDYQKVLDCVQCMTQLSELGFEMRLVKEAVLMCDNDVTKALDYLSTPEHQQRQQ